MLPSRFDSVGISELYPIASLVDVLEDHFVHVVEVDAGETFDGISALARDNDRNVLAAAIAVRRGTCLETGIASTLHTNLDI